jgi:hypothetical protein
MKRIAMLAVVSVCALVPATAQAQDGGFWEWLERMSGPKLAGFGTDLHVLCLDGAGRRFPCTRWFGLKDENFEFANIRHEVDARVGFYWAYGDRFADDPGDRRSIRALKMVGMYRFHPNTVISVGAGAGFLPLFGEGFESVSRGVLTPLSLVVMPFKGGGVLGRAFMMRLENSFLVGGVDGRDFGNTQTAFETGSEWNTSFAVGFDFRRR